MKHHGGGKICICLANVIFKQVCVSMSVLGCVSTMSQCHPALYNMATSYDNIFMSVIKLELPLVTIWDCLDLHFLNLLFSVSCSLLFLLHMTLKVMDKILLSVM